MYLFGLFYIEKYSVFMCFTCLCVLYVHVFYVFHMTLTSKGSLLHCPKNNS